MDNREPDNGSLGSLIKIKTQLVAELFAEQRNPWVRGIGIGIPPGAANRSITILVMAEASAPRCELNGIQRTVEQFTTNSATLLTSAFGGQSSHMPPPGTGISIAPFDPSQFNIPPVTAGTLGAIVQTSGSGRTQRYLLSSNHVLACNGRVRPGTGIFCPGPIEAVNGGVELGKRAEFVPLQPLGWYPGTSNTPAAIRANQVDCALAKATHDIDAPLSVPPLAFPIQNPIPVYKTGCASLLTTAELTIFDFAFVLDFGFGSYFFDNFVATAPVPVPSITNAMTGCNAFAAPGDSGALVLTDAGAQAYGVGLVTARAYFFDPATNFAGYIVAICRLDLVKAALEKALGKTVEFFGPARL